MAVAYINGVALLAEFSCKKIRCICMGVSSGQEKKKVAGIPAVLARTNE